VPALHRSYAEEHLTQRTPQPGVVTGGPVAAPGRADPSAIYEALRAQRRELNSQLEELQGTRREITSQMEDLSTDDASAHKPLQDRLTEVDGRIAAVDAMLAGNATQIAQAAAIPGAVVEAPRIIRNGPPDEAFVLGGIFMFVVLLPMSVAFARRIWRRGSTAVAAFPRELAERLGRIEHGLEATSLEVERIGEGQRFLTRLFTEGEARRQLPDGANQSVERKSAAPERLP
jgi:hypothetical protein